MRVLEHGAWQQVLVPLVYAYIVTAAPRQRANSRYFLAHAELTQSNPPNFPGRSVKSTTSASQHHAGVELHQLLFPAPFDFVEKLFIELV